METQEQLKELVKEKYSAIALQDKETNQSSCCGSGCCSDEVYNIMADDYTQLEGYNPDADLGLGCGLPTQFAKIKKGDVVIDLGSGAGNDAFIARHDHGAAARDGLELEGEREVARRGAAERRRELEAAVAEAHLGLGGMHVDVDESDASQLGLALLSLSLKQ